MTYFYKLCKEISKDLNTKQSAVTMGVVMKKNAKKTKEKKNSFNLEKELSSKEPSTWLVAGVIFAAILILINGFQISALKQSSGYSFTGAFASNGDLTNVDLSSIQNTAQSIAAVMPLQDVKDTQSAINAMMPKGTPEYGQALGVSYDDPLKSLDVLAKYYYQIKPEIQQNDPAIWQRYLALATKPVGISCEFCCGVGPVGITSSGELRCGCSHNPAVHALTLWLMKNTQYTDAEVLREAMRWKSIWFPKNMVNIALNIAGGDGSALNSMPSMVGGC